MQITSKPKYKTVIVLLPIKTPKDTMKPCDIGLKSFENIWIALRSRLPGGVLPSARAVGPSIQVSFPRFYLALAYVQAKYIKQKLFFVFTCLSAFSKYTPCKYSKYVNKYVNNREIRYTNANCRRELASNTEREVSVETRLYCYFYKRLVNLDYPLLSSCF